MWLVCGITLVTFKTHEVLFLQSWSTRLVGGWGVILSLSIKNFGQSSPLQFIHYQHIFDWNRSCYFKKPLSIILNGKEEFTYSLSFVCCANKLRGNKSWNFPPKFSLDLLSEWVSEGRFTLPFIATTNIP